MAAVKGTPGKATTGQASVRFSSQGAASKPSGKRPIARVMLTDGSGSVRCALRDAGAEVVTVNGVRESIAALAQCDGLVINGGTDVNPEIYGQREHLQTWAGSATRDVRELALLGAARDLGVPVLGICRGLQIIAVEAGGTLHQHIPDMVHNSFHEGHTFPVLTVRGTMLRKTLGERPEAVHLHHQAIDRVPKGFLVAARDVFDGVIEGIESFDGRVVATQFHPEISAGACDRRLFRAFAKACQRYRARHRDTVRPTLRDPQHYLDRWPVARDAWLAPNSRGYEWWEPTRKSSSAGSATKSTDAKVKVLVPAAKSSKASTAPALIGTGKMTQPTGYVAAMCGPCGISFDRKRDYDAHCEHFHVTGG
jgi:putative glutamine amidotransferase